VNQLRTPSLAWALGLLSVAFAWPGCSSDEADAETPTFRYRSETEFCNEVGNAACSSAVVNGCGFNSMNPDDISRCAAAVRSHCLDGSFDAARRKNTTGAVYQGAEAEACIQSVQAAHLDGTLTASDLLDINNRCDLVFSQRSGVGGACTEKADCAPSLNPSSVIDCFFQGGEGKCAVVTQARGGDLCSTLGTVCVDEPGRDLYCNGSNCVVKDPESPIVEPCVGNNNCLNSERCLPNPNAAMPGEPSTTCQAKALDNAPCARNEECVSGVCALRRDMTTGSTVRLCSVDVRLNNVDVPVCQPYRQ
jgi:hypothetical protein